MAQTVEWRVTGDGVDAVVLVEDSRVAEVAEPDFPLLDSYLAVTGDLSAWRGWNAWRDAGASNGDPDSWGDLIIQRASDGQVLHVNPDLYWEAIRRWYRARRSKQ